MNIMNTMNNIGTKSKFEDLDVWKKSRELRLELSSLINSFPKEEKYRLSDQIIRASRSVTNNIAEGYGRFHFQENIQFCRQARGSLYEIIDHILICFDEKFITEEYCDNMKYKIYDIIRSLNGYIGYLKKQKQLT